MIPGTSKILSKYGPGTLLIITKNASKNTRKIMESSWKYNIFVNMDFKKLKFSEQMYVLGTSFVFAFVCENLSTYFKNIFVEMRIENDIFPLIKWKF